MFRGSHRCSTARHIEVISQFLHIQAETEFIWGLVFTEGKPTFDSIDCYMLLSGINLVWFYFVVIIFRSKRVMVAGVLVKVTHPE